MVGANSVISFVGSGVGRSLNAGVQLLGRLARTIRRIVVLIIRCRGNEERDLAGTRDNQFVTGCRDGTALGLNLENGIVFELVIGNSARKGELIARGNRLATLFGGERDLDVHRFTLRGELTGDHVIGVAGKEFALISGTTLLEGDASKAILDIKGALVFTCPRIGEAVDLKVDVTPGLISSVAVLRTHKLIAQGRGLGALALGEELLDALEGLAVVSLVVEVAALIIGAGSTRATRPKGFLVEGEMFGRNLTIHVGAHITVADGQRTLLSDVVGVAAFRAGRLLIPKLERGRNRTLPVLCRSSIATCRPCDLRSAGQYQCKSHSSRKGAYENAMQTARRRRSPATYHIFVSFPRARICC